MLRIQLLQTTFDEIKMVLGYPLPRLFVVETVDKQWTAEERREGRLQGIRGRSAGCIFIGTFFSNDGSQLLSYIGPTNGEHGGYEDRHRNAGYRQSSQPQAMFIIMMFAGSTLSRFRGIGVHD